MIISSNITEKTTAIQWNQYVGLYLMTRALLKHAKTAIID